MPNQEYNIIMLESAIRDVIEITNFISNDSVKLAMKNRDSIYETIFSLKDLPNRGHYIPEFIGLDKNDFKEINFKSYRIIYQITSNIIYIHFVLDGRRNVMELLAKRMIKSINLN